MGFDAKIHGLFALWWFSDFFCLFISFLQWALNPLRAISLAVESFGLVLSHWTTKQLKASKKRCERGVCHLQTSWCACKFFFLCDWSFCILCKCRKTLTGIFQPDAIFALSTLISLIFIIKVCPMRTLFTLLFVFIISRLSLVSPVKGMF